MGTHKIQASRLHSSDLVRIVVFGVFRSSKVLCLFCGDVFKFNVWVRACYSYGFVSRFVWLPMRFVSVSIGLLFTFVSFCCSSNIFVFFLLCFFDCLRVCLVSLRFSCFVNTFA